MFSSFTIEFLFCQHDIFRVTKPVACRRVWVRIRQRQPELSMLLDTRKLDEDVHNIRCLSRVSHRKKDSLVGVLCFPHTGSKWVVILKIAHVFIVNIISV
ncbi:hypothetical protein CEXT_259251 [Caerostris extrusa]|uniref:Uncharacterized protein n=1 Tax=Caerostris extrusa TaxID=172846 RepID=A0AAV4PDF8_CAEEX|nr:hypothetical protein CEXT_259251 [Caerostris extrusa]